MLRLQKNLSTSAGLLCLALAFTNTTMAADLGSGGYNRKVETITFEQSAPVLVTLPIAQGDFNRWLNKQSGQ
ncbi:MAG: hypothetical protein PSV17_07670 [Methylotenera sp.]|uniref:hypothetical protein n=1 Tax=Methylotenera sp. TaxID=2051956 RepID=UPI002488E39D|nr:hypothetical protein [Methylotenera sp.]MDI1309297.1 hypothetical protein [Methylotenera sp.]